jgi:hypothetical protein
MSGTKEIYLPSSARTHGIAVPKRVESEIMREQAQMSRELDELSGKLRYYTEQLRDIFNDPYISVMLAKPNVTVDGLKPNYYHIIRMRPGTMAYIKPVENPDGTWRDLDSYVFTIAAEDDLWNDRTQKQLAKNRRKAAEAAERERIQARMDKAHEFDERLRSAVTTSISVPRSIK